MSISFAGSRCVDERRRRRLAQEADLEPQPERRGPVRARAESGSRKVEERRPPASPAESIVRPQLWAHVLITMLTMMAGAGLLLGGDWIDRHRPDLAQSFGLQAGRLVWLFHVGCLLLASQLAYINLWYRVRSRKDFSGRYRVWYFVVPAWLVFCACVATDGHHLLARAANARWPLPLQNAELLWWMTPTGVVLVTFARLLSHEMRRTRGGMLFLWTATIAALVNAAVLLGRPMLGESHSVLMIEQGLALLWPASLMLSMMYFARYVIHVSSEPSEACAEAETFDEESERRPGFFSRWRESRRKAQARRTEKRAKRAEEKARLASEKAAARAEAKKQAAEAAEKKKSTAKQQAGSAKKPVSAAPASKPPAKVDDEESGSSSRAKPARGERSAKPTRPAKVTRRDPPETPSRAGDIDEDESMQGLSKKERRRLRKLRRQRANAKGD